MNYKEILKNIASKNNTTPKEVDFEIQKALMLAGLNVPPSVFIAMVSAHIEKDVLS